MGRKIIFGVGLELFKALVEGLGLCEAGLIEDSQFEFFGKVGLVGLGATQEIWGPEGCGDENLKRRSRLAKAASAGRNGAMPGRRMKNMGGNQERENVGDDLPREEAGASMAMPRAMA